MMEDLYICVDPTENSKLSVSASVADRSEASKSNQELSFVPMVGLPTQEAVDGIRYDYCDGLRVVIPSNGTEHRIRYIDIATGLIVYQVDAYAGAIVLSAKKWVIPLKLEIYRKGEDKPCFEHAYNPRGKLVLMQLPYGAIGDTIAWFSYIEAYQQKWGCEIAVSMMPYMAELFKSQYPNMRFVTKEECKELKPYANYLLGLYFKFDKDHQPYDYREHGLHTQSANLLGLEGKEREERAPRVDLSAPREISERYVCIATKGSSQPKYWNNPSGWRELIQWLKDCGYRVLCIDRDHEHGVGTVWNYMPYGAEDYTGMRPLQERINLIKDADFFIGISSGLSWLAWCCKVPVVLISGFTNPVNEFYTPYRVINNTVCHGCWHDGRTEFEHSNFLWCPFQTDENRKFECTKAISSKLVIDTIKRIPGFRGIRAGQ